MHTIQHYSPDSLSAVDPATYSPGLNGAERAAVLLAKTDDLRSLAVTAGENRIMRFVFGASRSNRLADPRLEGLRRFAVALAHGQAPLAERERAELIDAGYTHAQLDQAAEIAAAFRRQGPAKIDRTEAWQDLRAFGTALVAAAIAFGVTAASAPLWMTDLPPTVAPAHTEALANN